MANTIDNKLKQSLLDLGAKVSIDPAEKIEEIKKGALARGVKPTDTSRFKIKAIRIGNQMIAQEELGKVELEFDRMAKMLVSYSGLKHEIDRKKAEEWIKERGRGVTLTLLAKSAKISELLVKHKIDAKKSASILAAWASMAAGAGQSLALGYGALRNREGKKPESVVGTLAGGFGGSRGVESGEPV